MSVNWNNVDGPEPDDEQPDEEQSSLVVTIFFVLIAIAALVGAAAFLNVTLLGTRIKQRAIADCDGPACILEVRTTHDDCFSDRMVFGMPGSMQDFQTPASANNLAFITVDYDDYAICAGVREEKQ